MGEPNVKSISFSIDPFDAYILVNKIAQIKYSLIEEASRVSIELNFETNRGNLIIVPRKIDGTKIGDPNKR